MQVEPISREHLVLRSKLLECKDIKSIVHMALDAVMDELDVQVASIFLFNKDGLLTRQGLLGFDWENKSIDHNNYLKEEAYLPGESLSRCAEDPVSTDDGYDYWSTYVARNLEATWGKLKFGKEYRDILGKLTCGVSSPLHGSNRSFGTIEVLNHTEGFFSQEDVFWLTSISASVANAISNVRRQNHCLICNEISQMILDNISSNVSSYISNEEYKEFCLGVAKQIVNPSTDYKACIIRLVSKYDGKLRVVAKAGVDGINWDFREDHPRSIGEGFTGTVFKEATPIIVNDAWSQMGKYKNITWMLANGLRSHICLPLIGGNQPIGTLSCFVGYSYPYKFYPANISYLKSIASLIATFSEEANLLRMLSKQRSNPNSEKLEPNDTHRSLHDFKDDVHKVDSRLRLLEISSSKIGVKERKILDEVRAVLHQMNQKVQTRLRASNTRLIDINRSVALAVKECTLQAEEFGIEISVEYDYSIPPFRAEESDILDIVTNLLTNSIRAIQRSARSKGAIEIKTLFESYHDPLIRIDIQDNGIGIDKSIKDMIFEKGFSQAQELGGTGTGLYIVKSIVESYSGEVTFHSSYGKYTKFTVRLPLDF
jgi:GAF domain-containing protein